MIRDLCSILNLHFGWWCVVDMVLMYGMVSTKAATFQLLLKDISAKSNACYFVLDEKSIQACTISISTIVRRKTRSITSCFRIGGKDCLELRLDELIPYGTFTMV